MQQQQLPTIPQPDQNNQEDIPLNTINLNTEHYNGQNVIQMPLQNNNSQEAQKQNLDFQQFGKQLQSPQNDYYTYPSNLELAELHRQCHYILPDEDFLQKCKADSCQCCQKPLRRKRFNALFADMYIQLADEFGITIPLYFTFIKFAIIVQILILGLYGIFFMHQVKIICNDPPIEICPNTIDCEECQFSGFYSYLDIDHFLWYMSTYQEEGYNYYQFATFFVFIINLSLPFCFEILIRYRQYQYWDKEPINHLHENRKSVYVRHLPYKMTQQEIQQFLKLSVSQDQNVEISTKVKIFEGENVIEEVIYIYDFSEITQKNHERETQYLNFLITLRQLEELKEEGKITTLTSQTNQIMSIDKLYSLMLEQYEQLRKINSGVNSILKEGLVFTNRVLVKFSTEEQSKITRLHYQRRWYKDILIRYQVMKAQQRYNKIRQQEKDNKPDLQKLKSEISPQKYQIQENSILIQLQEDFSNKFEEKRHFQVRTQGGFRAHEIFWDNLGMDAVQLIKYRVYAVLMIIVTLLFLMGGFEVIYVYQQNQKEKQHSGIQLSTAEKAITVIFTIVVALLSTKSTLTIMRNQQQSRRSTYTELEENIMKFFVFLHFCLINMLPYILKLEVWYARERVIAIYDLISLYQNRLIIKMVYHSLHIRHSKFWLQKRSILKNYNPYLQFQGQLNIKMTPPLYPIRSRNYLMLFNLTVSVVMIYVCPILVILCIIFNTYIYFYDKHAITHHYQIDRKFNIDHLSYLIKSYQFILFPFNIYLYIRLFYSFGWLTVVGAPVSGFAIIILIFLRKRIANYIVNNVLNQSKQKESNIYHEQPFIKSYQKFVKKLNIENLSSLLFNVFSINIKKQ